MAARTFVAVSLLTNFAPFTTREAVMVPTPDSRATSAMVGLPDGFLGMNSFIDYEMRPYLGNRRPSQRSLPYIVDSCAIPRPGLSPEYTTAEGTLFRVFIPPPKSLWTACLRAGTPVPP